MKRKTAVALAAAMLVVLLDGAMAAHGQPAEGTGARRGLSAMIRGMCRNGQQQLRHLHPWHAVLLLGGARGQFATTGAYWGFQNLKLQLERPKTVVSWCRHTSRDIAGATACLFDCHMTLLRKDAHNQLLECRLRSSRFSPSRISSVASVCRGSRPVAPVACAGEDRAAADAAISALTDFVSCPGRSTPTCCNTGGNRVAGGSCSGNSIIGATCRVHSDGGGSGGFGSRGAEGLAALAGHGVAAAGLAAGLYSAFAVVQLAVSDCAAFCEQSAAAAPDEVGFLVALSAAADSANLASTAACSGVTA